MENVVSKILGEQKTVGIDREKKRLTENKKKKNNDI